MLQDRLPFYVPIQTVSKAIVYLHIYYSYYILYVQYLLFVCRCEFSFQRCKLKDYHQLMSSYFRFLASCSNVEMQATDDSYMDRNSLRSYLMIIINNHDNLTIYINVGFSFVSRRTMLTSTVFQIHNINLFISRLYFLFFEGLLSLLNLSALFEKHLLRQNGLHPTCASKASKMQFRN